MNFLFAATLVFMSQVVGAQVAPNPNEIYVKNISANGSGCPAGTARSVLSPDGKTMSLLFDDYISQIDTSQQILDQKKCLVTIEMNIPAGWSYSLVSADYRGFAELDAHTMGTQEIVYMFGPVIEERPVPLRNFSVVGPRNLKPTRVRTATFSSRIVKGPFSGDYSFTNMVTVGEMPWSSCDSRLNRDLNIHTSLMTRSLTRVPTREKGMALIALDTIDATIAQRFDIAWKQCP
ncbi:MAG: DUF4360 domain-containing protein [Pseudomonadota bacterium]|nr:DUF4360 domain-containing protein [Pseudomonadota bacterium]